MDELPSGAAAPAPLQTTYDLVHPRALLRRVRVMTFDYVTAVRRHIGSTMAPVTCRSGCNQCCNAKILLDAGQGAVIYLALRDAGRWTPALEARLLAADREIAPVSHHDWFERRQPCVFLSGQGRCSIYDVRPVNCAITFSVSDPELCRVGHGHSSFQVVSEEVNMLVEVPNAFMTAAEETAVWIMTLPAAVLYGKAMIERLPRPHVARVEHGDEIIERFDGLAAAFYEVTPCP